MREARECIPGKALKGLCERFIGATMFKFGRLFCLTTASSHLRRQILPED